MKNINIILIITLILFALNPLKTEAQIYKPFPVEEAYWTVREFNGNNYEAYIYTIKDDTTIDSKHYKKIWQLDNIPNTNDTLWTLHSFLRQDTLLKRVWFIRWYLNETIEKLGYDFSKQAGDTVYLPAFDYENSGDSAFVVQFQDIIQLNNGEDRKSHFFMNLNRDIGLDPYVIEGIGTQRTPFPNLHYFDAFHQSELICHFAQGVFLYGATSDECGFSVNIDESQDSEMCEMFPNPCQGYLKIYIKDKDVKRIGIIDQFGRIILQQEVNSKEDVLIINTTSFSNGLYVMNFTNKRNKVFTKKILINQ